VWERGGALQAWEGDGPMSKGISRRQFAALGTAVALAGTATVASAAVPVTHGKVKVPTRDGAADGMFFHPVDGQHPGVVLWPDVGGLRDANLKIGQELAAAGFAVLMVDASYRSGEGGGRAALADNLRPELIQRDGADFSAWLDAQPQTASAAKGYSLRAMGPSPSLLSIQPRAKRAKRASSGYLVALPAGNKGLTATQLAALDRAIGQTDQLAAAEANTGLAA